MLVCFHYCCPVCNVAPVTPFYQHGSILIPAWIGNSIHYEVRDEITYPFPNFNGSIVHSLAKFNSWPRSFSCHNQPFPPQDRCPQLHQMQLIAFMVITFSCVPSLCVNCNLKTNWKSYPHDDVIIWKHFTRYWPFALCGGIHWSHATFLWSASE